MSLKIKDKNQNRGHGSKLDFLHTFYIDTLLHRSKQNGVSLF